MTLASWNDGDARRAILPLVDDVTREGGEGDVPPEERVAVFDKRRDAVVREADGD